jgi:hypothetical protein
VLAAALPMPLAAAAASLQRRSSGPAPPPPSSGRLKAPAVLATGVPIRLRGSGVPPVAGVRIERRRRGRWWRLGSTRADARGR